MLNGAVVKEEEEEEEARRMMEERKQTSQQRQIREKGERGQALAEETLTLLSPVFFALCCATTAAKHNKKHDNKQTNKQASKQAKRKENQPKTTEKRNRNEKQVMWGGKRAQGRFVLHHAAAETQSQAPTNKG